MADMHMDALTDQQRLFVEHYLTCLNGAEAARRAGYSERTARAQASRLLTHVNIRAAIDAGLAARAPSKAEIVARLAEHATGSMADFLTVRGKGVSLDLKKALAADRLHLVKRYSKTKQGVSIELYDAQAALIKLGEAAGVFRDRSADSLEQLAAAAEAARRALDRKLDPQPAAERAPGVPGEPDAA